MVEFQTNEFLHPVINKSQDSPKFSEIKHNAYVLQSSLLFFSFCIALENGIHMIKSPPK